MQLSQLRPKHAQLYLLIDRNQFRMSTFSQILSHFWTLKNVTENATKYSAVFASIFNCILRSKNTSKQREVKPCHK